MLHPAVTKPGSLLCSRFFLMSSRNDGLDCLSPRNSQGNIVANTKKIGNTLFFKIEGRIG